MRPQSIPRARFKTSNEAFGSVEVAASAANELAESIAEINRQLARAAEVVKAAA